MPNGAKLYADSIVIGEAEEIWQRLIKDFKTGELRAFYQGDKFPGHDKMPIPRRNLLKQSKLGNFVTALTFSRDCPYNCEFCSVSHFLEESYIFVPLMMLYGK